LNLTSTIMKLLHNSPDSDHALKLDNTVDALSVNFEGAAVIELHFPKFTDGRAYSQAHVLRRRGFSGDLRATGEVLVDQLVQLKRCGFSSVVLRADQSMQTAQRLLNLELPAYQGDALRPQPHFARSTSA
jgi:uncharacterized protein (DUF934 family)